MIFLKTRPGLISRHDGVHNDVSKPAKDFCLNLQTTMVTKLLVLPGPSNHGFVNRVGNDVFYITCMAPWRLFTRLYEKALQND